MLRLCFLSQSRTHACAASGASLTALSAPLLCGSRAYATAHQSTRSSIRERRYYTDPLRTPQTGVRTVVGRFAQDAKGAGVNAAGDADTPAVEDVRSTSLVKAKCPSTHAAASRSLTVWRHPIDQLAQVAVSHGRTVRYNDAGVPVEGSWYLLPWHEQMRIFAAVMAALCITKAFFDVVRFELLYYGVWKVGYRNDNSFTKRVLYYGSTALLATGLVVSFNLNFFLSAALIGRRAIAAHILCNGFARVLPHRAVQLVERRMKLSFV